MQLLELLLTLFLLLLWTYAVYIAGRADAANIALTDFREWWSLRK